MKRIIWPWEKGEPFTEYEYRYDQKRVCVARLFQNKKGEWLVNRKMEELGPFATKEEAKKAFAEYAKMEGWIVLEENDPRLLLK